MTHNFKKINTDAANKHPNGINSQACGILNHKPKSSIDILLGSVFRFFF